jgi:hypothetical protein
VELEVAEVVWSDAESKDLLDDRKQVMQRPNGLEGDGIGVAEDTARRGQDERVFNDGHRHATIIKSGGEDAIIAANSAGGSRCPTIRVKNAADIVLLENLHDILFSLEDRGVTARRCGRYDSDGGSGSTWPRPYCDCRESQPIRHS